MYCTFFLLGFHPSPTVTPHLHCDMGQLQHLGCHGNRSTGLRPQHRAIDTGLTLASSTQLIVELNTTRNNTGDVKREEGENMKMILD